MGGVQGTVGVGEPAVAGLVTVRAQQLLQELFGSQTDRPVDAGHGNNVPRLAQRLPPGHGVQVGRVDRGSVDVEQGSGRYG
ncbi:hypothetical protein [Streptacidiphilus sp. P02-A3a]|uniref:hypothetical protein n=1 Tax=Streptacidiphilus sp. P02-A3a TaxID=2704468 RepID=UPI00351A95B7